jgi:hypothetical protein
MEGSILKPDLSVPEPKTASLTFCETSPKAFRQWVDRLPVANIGEASRLLYNGIIELKELQIAPQQRLQLLELIRPRIHFVCRELARHYLGMAVALPEKQRKIANLSQSLQLHCANGYKLTILELIDYSGVEKHRRLLAQACHRAISELGNTIVRAHQLYCPSPANSWLECHRIYRFALRNKLTSVQVDDETLRHRTGSTLDDAYKRLLLLGCSRPNQLRQNELTLAYDLFEHWTDRVECIADAQKDTLFVVEQERDAPPVYRSLLTRQDITGDTMGFESRNLSRALDNYLHAQGERAGAGKGQAAPNDLQIPATVNTALLQHLSQAFGILTKRNFNRIPSRGSLEVCVGLTAAHYFISGETSFQSFLQGNNEEVHQDNGNRFSRAAQTRNDAWAEAHDAGPSEDRLYSADTPITFRGSFGNKADSEADRSRPARYRATMVNTSPGGYCIRWDTNVPASLQAGEIVGIREQASHPWSLALVRWLRQVRGQGTQLGLELLAPNAAPCGVRLIQKVGQNSEYLRGLILPEISVVHQAATIITPRLPFQSGSRISLLHDGQEDHGALGKKITSTGSISQFEIKLRNIAPPKAGSQKGQRGGTSEDEFDSLWPSL